MAHREDGWRGCPYFAFRWPAFAVSHSAEPPHRSIGNPEITLLPFARRAIPKIGVRTVKLTRALGGAARRVLIFVVVVASAVASYTGVSLARSSTHSIKAVSTSSTRPAPVNPVRNGQHLIAYVVVASDCGFSTRPDVEDAVRHLRDVLLAAHGQSYAQVSVVALDVDQDVATGLEFLKQFQKHHSGPVFDQVSVGGVWVNDGFVNLGWRERLATGATPEIDLIERPVDSHHYLVDWTVSIGRDALLLRVAGYDQIARWVQEGAPLRGTRL